MTFSHYNTIGSHIGRHLGFLGYLITQ